MDRKQLIKEFLDFYKSKGHKEIQNASLIPANDPTVLFTTAGMHPIVPYLLGQPHPLGKRLTNVQRCIRTVDFENIGDTYHHTFFEMLGKWSVGDYFKKEAIGFTFEFYTKILKIPIERLGVTCFIGDKDSPKDNEAAETWGKLGISKDRIAFLPKEDNWWETPGPGPCGPDTEIFYWKLNNEPAPKKFDPKNKNWVEIGNDVLMQYEKDKSGNYKEAKQKNIDFGGGVERTITVLSGLEDNYLSSAFLPIIEEIEHLSSKTYKGNEKTMRIIADHIKASVFIIADGVSPSNTEQGYVLRRLIRRAIMNLRKLGFVGTGLINPIARKVFEIYDDYDILKRNQKKIYEELEKEENKFDETLEQGIKEVEKIIKNKPKEISGKQAFLLYQSYGFPLEITKELASEKKIIVNEKEFNKELEIHQELSRTATAGKFKSGLADNSEQTKKLHTATHLLLAALKRVLKTEISQKGSNITPERLRFDFNFPRKLTDAEIKEVEKIVNQKIVESIPIACETMSPEQAKKQGATGVFDDKYGDKVTVYSAGTFSKEICAGPHADNTSELGNFKIQKEESSSSGVRIIKAVLE
ncbi:Alanine--tRNA ligase [uncultured archaeon]|nr:Alanine--tRNA ligase [uncultured archaeon]